MTLHLPVGTRAATKDAERRTVKSDGYTGSKKNTEAGENARCRGRAGILYRVAALHRTSVALAAGGRYSTSSRSSRQTRRDDRRGYRGKSLGSMGGTGGEGRRIRRGQSVGGRVGGNRRVSLSFRGSSRRRDRDRLSLSAGVRPGARAGKGTRECATDCGRHGHGGNTGVVVVSTVATGVGRDRVTRVSVGRGPGRAGGRRLVARASLNADGEETDENKSELGAELHLGLRACATRWWVVGEGEALERAGEGGRDYMVIE
ncbi:hypothetical protein EIP86_007589 [Pleurotus ostreatoroseus]|nr:hypothetical protein EIP86_007589 [Pleurotus ostreatoroseus]